MAPSRTVLSARSGEPTRTMLTMPAFLARAVKFRQPAILLVVLNHCRHHKYSTCKRKDPAPCSRPATEYDTVSAPQIVASGHFGERDRFCHRPDPGSGKTGAGDHGSGQRHGFRRHDGGQHRPADHPDGTGHGRHQRPLGCRDISAVRGLADDDGRGPGRPFRATAYSALRDHRLRRFFGVVRGIGFRRHADPGPGRPGHRGGAGHAVQPGPAECLLPARTAGPGGRFVGGHHFDDDPAGAGGRRGGGRSAVVAMDFPD